MNYTISVRGSSAGAGVWAAIQVISTNSGEGGRGGKEGPGAGSTSFPASGGRGEAGGSGEEGPGARSASFLALDEGEEGGGGGEEGPRARCAEKLSMKIEILSQKDYTSDLTFFRRMVTSSSRTSPYQKPYLI